MSIDKKEHIMEVAVTLFSEKGYEGTSIRDLAHAADVNIAMINYYFGSKEKLFVALLETKARYMREKIDSLQNDPSLSELPDNHFFQKRLFYPEHQTIMYEFQ